MPTTVGLLLAIWFFSNLGYGLFNSQVPRLLIDKQIDSTGSSDSAVYFDALLYAAAGVPGSFLGAILVESPWGRRGTMAFGTACLTLSLGGFVIVTCAVEVIIAL